MLSPDILQRNLANSGGMPSFRSSSIVRSNALNMGPLSRNPLNLYDEIERRLDKVRTEDDIDSFVHYMLTLSSQAYQGKIIAAKLKMVADDKLNDRLS